MLGNLSGKKALRWIMISAILLCISIMLELFISNYRNLFIDNSSYETEIDGIALLSIENADDVIPVRGQSLNLVMENTPADIYAVQIGFAGAEKSYFNTPVTLTLKASDPRNPRVQTVVASTYIAPSENTIAYETVYVDLRDMENKAVTLSFSNVVDKFDIVSLTVNPSNTLSFNFIRMLAILIAAALIALSAMLGLHKEPFDSAKLSHIITVGIVCLICISGVAVFCGNIAGGKGTTAYPLESGVNNYNPYIQQTDAFLKGQLNIDYYPSNAFLELENPYDPSEREGLYYLWDRAYYDGEYFSYFGIAPIINIYLPYYLLTGSLPSDNIVITLYSIATCVFICLFLIGYVIFYKKKIPLTLFCIGIISAVVSSNLLLMARGVQHFYYMAVLAGMAYLSAFLFFLMLALNTENKIRRPIFFAIAGLMFAFLFMSRVNMAFITAFIVVPVLIFGIILEKPLTTRSGVAVIRRTGKQKLLDLGCLAAFVVIAGAFTLWFNNARFDSPFEFGTTYQLTVSDISKNHLRLSAFPAAVYHYFIQPLGISGNFPYFTLLYSNLSNYGAYVYVDTGMGLFAIPLMLGLLGLIFVFVNRRHTRFMKTLCAALVIGCLITAWIDFCLGGVIFRYTSDMTLLCSVAAVLSLFSIYEESTLTEGAALSTTVRLSTELLMLFSVFVCLCVAISLNGNLQAYDARIFVDFMHFFSSKQ